MKQLGEQLPAEQEQQIVIFDSGGYSQANVSKLQQGQDTLDQSCARNLHSCQNRTARRV